MDETCESGEKSAQDVAPKRKERSFDFGKFAQRHIALLVGYAGWDYDGLVVQVVCGVGKRPGSV